MRAVFLSLAVGLLILPGGVQASTREREKASISSTQTLSFDPEGVIQLEQSFGDVQIEGWDRPEVEITTIRSTQRKYTESERIEARRELENIAITAVKQGEDRLKITTQFPSRRMAGPLRGKTDADLKYVIKAPAQAKLVVHHDIGQVTVKNFTSDIEVTNRIGEIGLTLPEPESYAVDASVRIGELSSDVGCSEGRNLMGHQLHTEAGAMHRQLYLRVGIGDISIKKIQW
jgi:hypothetical protein